jgi:hypothetical protein
MLQGTVKFLTMAALGGALVLAVSSSQPSGAAAPAGVTIGGVFQLKSAADQSFCLDIDNQGPTPQLILSQCTAASSQRFSFTRGADGFSLMIDSQGNCLSTGAKSAPNFFGVSDALCKYTGKERWALSLTGTLAQGSKGRCLAIPRVGANESVHLVPCQEVTLQHWKLSQ